MPMYDIPASVELVRGDVNAHCFTGMVRQMGVSGET